MSKETKIIAGAIAAVGLVLGALWLLRAPSGQTTLALRPVTSANTVAIVEYDTQGNPLKQTVVEPNCLTSVSPPASNAVDTPFTLPAKLCSDFMEAVKGVGSLNNLALHHCNKSPGSVRVILETDNEKSGDISCPGDVRSEALAAMVSDIEKAQLQHFCTDNPNRCVQ